MKVKLKTQTFKSLLSKSSIGVGDNKLLPITSLLGISIRGSRLDIITTDGSNWLVVGSRLDEAADDDFSVTVYANQFISLVSKMTCGYITLELIDKSLKIVGNGKYTIELPINENGELIDYPNPTDTQVESDIGGKIQRIDIMTAKNLLSPSLAKTFENPCYTNFYFGDIALATDTYVISALKRHIFSNQSELFEDTTQLLISPELIKLVCLCESEYINYRVDGNKIIFYDDDIFVSGTLGEGVDDYAVDAITRLVNSDNVYDYSCIVDKNALISAIDRTMLFVDVYDKNAIELIFDSDTLIINNCKNNCTETVKYCESLNSNVNFACTIDGVILAQQLKANVDDMLTIQFGTPESIKITSDVDTVQILALIEN